MATNGLCKDYKFFACPFFSVAHNSFLALKGMRYQTETRPSSNTAEHGIVQKAAQKAFNASAIVSDREATEKQMKPRRVFPYSFF